LRQHGTDHNDAYVAGNCLREYKTKCSKRKEKTNHELANKEQPEMNTGCRDPVFWFMSGERASAQRDIGRDGKDENTFLI
jgi:hypothetical protein